MTETIPYRSGAPDATAAVPGLRVDNVSKSFGTERVLNDVSLTVPKGELHALLGASGSGKTTLLRIIGGFTDADSGVVTIQGRDVTWASPESRHTGFVFQSYALFPHMNVFDNIAFGLRLQRRGKKETSQIVTETCDLARVPRDLFLRKPTEISGGQQQRVAIARALATRPSVLLLDEPLSALDRKVRQEVREELKRIQRDADITTIFVTHDQEEALYLADRVLVMDRGVIVQSDEGPQVYGLPQSAFVAGFIGSVNLLSATVRWNGAEPERVTANINGKSVDIAGCVASRRAAADNSASGVLAVRPEQILIEPVIDATRAGQLIGRITDVEFTGSTTALHVAVGQHSLAALVLSRDVLGRDEMAIGRSVGIAFAAGTVVMPADVTAD